MKQILHFNRFLYFRKKLFKNFLYNRFFFLRQHVLNSLYGSLADIVVRIRTIIGLKKILFFQLFHKILGLYSLKLKKSFFLLRPCFIFKFLETPVYVACYWRNIFLGKFGNKNNRGCTIDSRFGGFCNGFQILTNAGLLPGNVEAALAIPYSDNKSGLLAKTSIIISLSLISSNNYYSIPPTKYKINNRFYPLIHRC